MGGQLWQVFSLFHPQFGVGILGFAHAVYRNSSAAELRMKAAAQAGRGEHSQSTGPQKGTLVHSAGKFTCGNRELSWSERITEKHGCSRRLTRGVGSCGVLQQNGALADSRTYLPVLALSSMCWSESVLGREGDKGCSPLSFLHSE